MKGRPLFIILLVLAVPFFSIAEVRNVPGVVATTPPEIARIIEQILQITGLRATVEIREANVPNAAAVSFRGKKYVLYNPEFIRILNKATGNKWASVSVLAHEVGHHVGGHTMDGAGSTPDTELEADVFSGYVLRKMGASLDDAQSAMKLAANRRRTKTHPAQHERLVAIAKGWYAADDQGSVARGTQAEKSFKDQIVRELSKYMLANVHFNKDASSNYFITSRRNVVKLVNDKLVIVGKMAPLDHSQYPFVIFDDDTHLFVDREGHIISSSGQRVGLVKAFN